MKDFPELENLLAAKMPIVAVESTEERGILKLLERFATLNERQMWRWSVTEGLRRPNSNDTAYNTTRIEDALRHIEKSPANAIYVFLDAHRFIGDPVVLRQIKDIAEKSEWTHLHPHLHPHAYAHGHPHAHPDQHAHGHAQP